MNIQKKLLRVRPPRVRITYDLDLEGTLEKRELPFVIGVIADLQGNKRNNNNYQRNKFVELTQDNFARVMQSIKPELSIKVKNLLSNYKIENDLVIDNFILNLSFTSMESFKPDLIIQIPEFQKVLQDRKHLVDLISKIESNRDFKEEITDILNNKIVFNSINDKDDKNTSNSKKIDSKNQKNNDPLNKDVAIRLSNEYFGSENYIETIFSLKRVKGEVKDLYAAIITTIADLDKSLSMQMDEILHHPEFQALEASWRGLNELISRIELSEYLKVRVLNSSIIDLEQDLLESSDFDQTHLFKLVYEEEYGTMGGIPFSCFIVDLFFSKSIQDVKLIRFLSSIAAAAHAPLLTGTKPEMFNLQSFMDLHLPRDLKTIFESSDAIYWNQFRDTEEARYANLFLPYVLMRMPYGSENLVRSFNYNETINGERNNNFCWGNAAYFMGIKLGEAIAKYGWAAAIRGPEGGGLVKDLPAYTFRTSFGDISMKCPTQTHITDRREKELSDLGFIALCHKKMTNQAVFFSGQTAQKAKKHKSEDADANSNLSSKMPYMLNASRFIHYIKVILRDKVGSFQSPKNVETFLQSWIAEYVLLSDETSQEIKAEYPLREAQIKVQESEVLGEYSVTMNLRPHFQMEALNICLRFVAKIFSEK